MRRFSGSFLLLIVVCWMAPNARAEWVPVGDGSGLRASILESSPGRIAVEFTLGGFERTAVTISGRDYAVIRLPNEAVTLEKGLPDLPRAARSVIIPNDRLMKLRVVSAETVDLPGIDPAPSKGNLDRTVDPANIPYEFGPFYESDRWYPSVPAEAREPYILRDYRGETLVANLIRYQPSTHTLRVCTRLVVELLDGGPGGPNVLPQAAPPAGVQEGFSEIYREHFLNYGTGERYQMVPEIGSMLVIAYDAFAAAVQPLVNWKNRMGIPTTMVLKSQVGTTAAEFQTYIRNVYNSSPSPRLASVLLVGDADQIPTPLAPTGGAADPLYSKIVGSDNYPDIFIGRFSAETLSQVQTQVQRTIDYEAQPQLTGPAWYARATGIASDQGPGDDGEYDFQHVGVIRGLLLGYGYSGVDQIYDPGATAMMVTQALNSGRSLINYCGHGSSNGWTTTGFSIANVNQLQNDHMLPIIFSVGCANGQFLSNTCFAEAWLRATRAGVPIGAVAAYMSSVDQSWSPPMCAQDESNRLLVVDAARTFGSLCYNGSCQMMDEYGNPGVSMFNTWHIFGDPSLRFRSKAPLLLVVTYPPTIDRSSTAVTVNVLGASGILCGLSYNGAYLGSAYSDDGGQVVIPVSGTLPDGQIIDLTVTGYNAIPYTRSIQVLGVPSITFSPTALDIVMAPDTQVDRVLEVGNAGDPSSTLGFRSHFGPDSAGFVLQVSPDSGMVSYGQSTDLTVTISAAGMPLGDYGVDLILDYNPAQTAVVPITIHVTDPAGTASRDVHPLEVALQAGRPNPFRDSTVLRYALPEEGVARLAVYDAAGRMVRLLSDGTAAAGYHPVRWDGRDIMGRPVSTGVYFARLQAGGRVVTERLLRIR